MKKQRMRIDDFTTVKCIGRGAFGEVHVVSEDSVNRFQVVSRSCPNTKAHASTPVDALKSSFIRHETRSRTFHMRRIKR
jgi:hypothetical protein